ncbi:MAG: hypothetical protein A3H27_01820 [Acidobacteria bacterium RIFCSPLOWO2_02_FULL_59_13]|nr:MAG: hypothetical protein A3H27_01820 [Acidobacteria bacterium RIFCSPLOWO2_02_FULL_59_13]
MVVEDVLIYRRIRAMAEEAGLRCGMHFYPSWSRRGSIETVYYGVIKSSGFLQRILPCMINYEFRKREVGVGQD